ncbi:MAG: YebC/PmpR family DNA-binding transcriptional regulator, partial [Exiguobacterium sp.]|nr:YebC/PmpR family DNA-binding transcriptional regulator [Exiguobacterium sp.]
GVNEMSADDVLELMMEHDLDVRDVIEEDETVIVYAEPEAFHAVQTAFKAAGVEEFAVAELTMLPQNEVSLDAASQEQFEKLIDVLEDLEDVRQVYHNVEM